MAGIDLAKAKYALKLTVMERNYADAMSAFFGRDVSTSIPVRAYAAKMGPETADKWERGLRTAFGV